MSLQKAPFGGFHACWWEGTPPFLGQRLKANQQETSFTGARSAETLVLHLHGPLSDQTIQPGGVDGILRERLSEAKSVAIGAYLFGGPQKLVSVSSWLQFKPKKKR